MSTGGHTGPIPSWAGYLPSGILACRRNSDKQVAMLDRIAGSADRATRFGAQLRRLREAEGGLAALDALGDEEDRNALQALIDEARCHYADRPTRPWCSFAPSSWPAVSTQRCHWGITCVPATRSAGEGGRPGGGRGALAARGAAADGLAAAGRRGLRAGASGACGGRRRRRRRRGGRHPGRRARPAGRPAAGGGCQRAG